MKETEAKLLKIQDEEAKNQKELDRIMNKSKEAAAKAEKHMSFREKSIKAREDKKARKRAASKGAFNSLKSFFIVLVLTLIVIGVLAILGCEMEMDGLKESFVCKIGAPRSEERPHPGKLKACHWTACL